MKPFEERLRYEYALTPESLVVDCGGYEGQFARTIHRRYGCRVWVFEPVFHATLIETLADVYPKVRVFPVGLGTRNASVELKIKGNMTGEFAEGDPVTATLWDAVDALNEPTALLKLNCEGAEFAILEAILERGNPTLYDDIQVQPHPGVPDCEARWNRIHDRLTVTHELTFHEPWCWSNYRIK